MPIGKESVVIRIIALFLFAVLFTLTALTPAYGQDALPSFSPQIRLLVHGTKVLKDMEEAKPSVGLGMWVIEPNILDANPQAQTTLGLRLSTNTTWIEFLGGGVVSPTTTGVFNPVFDVRAFADLGVHLFSEVSLYGDAAYWYVSADAPIKSGGKMLFKIGGEAEGAKTYRNTGGFFAAGPHVVIPWGDHFATMVVFQFRIEPTATVPIVSTVGRLYAIINF